MISRVQHWLERRRAYRHTFLRSDDGKPDRATEAVLKDLARFCCANTTTIRVSPVGRTIDPLAMAVAEGRREVFLRIAKFLYLTDADIARFLESEGRTND